VALRYIVAEKLLVPWDNEELTLENVGQKIRETRAVLRLSMYRLSLKSGLTMVTLSRVERGIGKARTSTITKIFKALQEVEDARRRRREAASHR
jgi:transcriptional regulator with XRE-family HTH domain